jgi:hypothetical protein
MTDHLLQNARRGFRYPGRKDHPMFDQAEETPEQELDRLRRQDTMKDGKIRNLQTELKRFETHCLLCDHSFLPDDFKYVKCETSRHCSDECEELERRLNEADRLGDEKPHGER